MIRDPSDGTVREKPSKEITLEVNENGHKSGILTSKEIASGLPIRNLKPDELERLEQSRKWLKQRKGE